MSDITTMVNTTDFPNFLPNSFSFHYLHSEADLGMFSMFG